MYKTLYTNELTVDTRSEVFTAVKTEVEVFWVGTPCSIAVRYQCFRGIASQKTST
jgi:hypothetical protein